MSSTISLSVALPTIVTDLPDYAPGATAKILIAGFGVGATVEVRVSHASDSGADGVWGTADDARDEAQNAAGGGHTPWSVTDGVLIRDAGADGELNTADDILAGDLDGVANGTIVTSWFVNPDDSLGAHFLATATDGATVASTGFTDSNPPPVQTFYVPLPEAQVLQSLQTIQPGASGVPRPIDPVNSVTSIAIVADNTRVYYDHWEDGYEADLANPTQATTRIWGDGNLANGAAPGDADDVLHAGDVILLRNAVNTATPLVIDYDGGDKFASTKTVAVGRTLWATDSETLFSDAVEVYDTDNWGTHYKVPIGENIASNEVFSYAGLSIMAGRGGATVQIDANADGVAETTVTLTEGQAYLVDGSVNLGASITSDKPVQVDLLTGDRGSSYEARWMTLLPTDIWSTSYYTPVSTANGDATLVWLYNPAASPITVSYDMRIGGSIVHTSTSVGANGYSAIELTEGSGAHFYTAPGGATFYALTTIDSDGSASDNQAFDWGMTLVPVDSLTPQVLVGLGFGQDPNWGGTPENGSPIWITPIGNGETPVTVYVDYNGDGGLLTDPNGNGYDAAVALKELQNATLRDPDGNQTGTLVYVLDPNVKLAAAWGEEPGTASAGRPGFDAGMGIPPLPLFDAGKAGTLKSDLDGSGNLSAGDVLHYTIVINNISRAPVPDLILKDILPADTTYVLGSATFTNAAGVTSAIPDSASGTPFPFDVAGVLLDPLTALKVKGSYTIEFDVKLDSYLAMDAGRTEIVNAGSASAVGYTINFSATNPLNWKAAIDIEKLVNGADADTAADAISVATGSAVTWTYEVRNTGNVFLKDIQVTDNHLSVTPTYVSGDDGDNVLEMGETWIYSAAGTAISGPYSNIGTATGTAVYANGTTPIPGIAKPSDTDAAHYTGVYNPDLKVEKSYVIPGDADDKIDSAADDVQYTLKVTNTGNQTLTNVVLTDPLAVSATNPTGTFEIASLAPGASYTVSFLYDVPQSVIDANGGGDGDLDNTATGDSDQTDPDNPGPTPDRASVEVPILRDPGLDVLKVADVALVDEAGDRITYTYTVTNTGNTTLTGVTLVDDNYTPGDASDDIVITLDRTTLAPGQSATGTYEKTVTQAEIDAGTALKNVATGDSNETSPDTDDETVTVVRKPDLLVEKRYVIVGDDDQKIDSATDDVTYTIKVTNTGNTTLTNVVITDPLAGGQVGAVIASLAPGQSAERSFIYDVPQSVIDTRGGGDNDLDNTATGDSDQTDPDNPGPTPDRASVEVPIVSTAAIDLTKFVQGQDANAGPGPDLIEGTNPLYTFTVANTGNVNLTNVVLRDDNATPANATDDYSPTRGADVVGDNDGVLEIGEIWSYAWTGAWREGPQLNTATVTGDQIVPDVGTITLTDTDIAIYNGVKKFDPPPEGPGVRTPGFWTNNNWQKFWDGQVGNEPHQAGTPGFPGGELLTVVVDPVTGSSAKGLLIGDGDNSLFFTRDEAWKLINASQKDLQDARYVLGRDLVATWLNFLAGNGVGDNDPGADTDRDPWDFIEEAIAWFQKTTKDENGDGKGDGNVTFAPPGAVAQSSPAWQTGFPGVLSGSAIHTALDGYNNTGMIDGIVYAPDADL